MAQWAEHWYEIYKKPVVGNSAQVNTVSILNKHILPAIGHLFISDIRQDHLQTIMNAQKGKSTSQTLKIKNTLNQIFLRSKQNKLIMDNPAELLDLPQTTQKKRRSLTTDESNVVKHVCENHRAGLWVLFMLYCGLRRGEVVPLRWSDIDFEREELTINKAVEFINNKAVLKDTKTMSGNRTIPIPVPLIERLKSERGDLNNLIFMPAKSRNMLTETNCKRLWTSFKRDLDIASGATVYRNKIVKSVITSDIDEHSLRHTFITDMALMGIDMKTAQRLAGHADFRTTNNIYTHAREEMLLEAKEKMRAYYERI